MIIFAITALVVLSVPLTGGRLGRLRTVQLTATWAPLVALGLQLLAIDGPASHLEALAWAMHAVSYALAVWFLWANRRVPGLPLIGSGGIANLAAISANGGVMPAHPAALALSGRDAAEGFVNSSASSGSALWFLGDVFAIPAGWPFANVFSVGDLVLVIGLAALLHRVSRTEAPAGDVPSRGAALA